MHTSLNIPVSQRRALLSLRESPTHRAVSKPFRLQLTELRHFRMELRVTGDDDAPVLEGHIAVFNKLSEDLGGFREKIEPGAFADSIARDDIRALWNHQNDLVLGRTSAGTLELSEDAVGLRFRNRPPETTWFRDRMISVRRGDVTGASFGFITEVDEWAGMGNARIRTLKKIRLIEVSPGVTFPAYVDTDIALRRMQAWIMRGLPWDLQMKKLRLRLHELDMRSRLRPARPSLSSSRREPERDRMAEIMAQHFNWLRE